MQKLRKYLVISIIIISISFILFHDRKKYLSEDNILGVYINNELSDNYPSKDSAMFQKAVCDDSSIKVTWDNDNWGLLISNLNKKVKCNLYFYSGQTVFDFDYTGGEQTFIAPVSGTYKLETWGAQGGNTNTDFGGITTSRIGGSGGYSVGYFNLHTSKQLFLNIGQGGKSTPVDSSGSSAKCFSNSTFNGGGSAYIYNCVDSAGSGGGATHIATKSGQLHTLEKYKEQILIVSGGGGGSYAYPEFAANGGSGGGFKGELPSGITSDGICGRGRSLTLGNKASQKFGGSTSGCYVNNSINAMFGLGESTVISKYEGGQNDGSDAFGSGGGGGFYGGGAGRTAYGAGGGSGYIGNPLLKDKVMYCYNCEESNEESTKTISTTCSEETPTTNCAKKGNGYARITLVSIDE